MKENETDFSKSKVGDECWSSTFGEGMIIYRSPDGEQITVDHPIGGRWSYTIAGIVSGTNQLRTLFWSPIHIIPPPRPKRVVKKVLEGWLDIYPDRAVFYTDEEILSVVTQLGIITRKRFEHEYEVEE